jgi:hypothetical protein
MRKLFGTVIICCVCCVAAAEIPEGSMLNHKLNKRTTKLSRILTPIHNSTNNASTQKTYKQNKEMTQFHIWKECPKRNLFHYRSISV